MHRYAKMFPFIRNLSALSLVVCQSACAIGPDFHSPAAPLLSKYTSDPQIERDGKLGAQSLIGGTDIPGQWWALFHSKQINALVEEAMRSHPDLRAAQAALRQARELALAERGSLFPSANATETAENQQASGAPLGERIDPIEFKLYESTAAVSYVPDVFGKAARGIEAADAQAETAQFELEAADLALTANVVTAAINDASLTEQIKVTQDIVAAEREQLVGLNKELSAGAIGQGDLAQQKAELAQTLATLPPLMKARAQQRDALMAYLGRFPSQDDGKAVSLGSLTLPRRLPVSLPARLVRQRPDVRVAESQLHAASAQVGVSLANMLPEINLTAGGGSQSLNFDQLFNSQTMAWNVAAGVTLPLFDAGTLYHRKEASIAALDEATQKYKSTVITAFENVADSIKALKFDAQAIKAEDEAQKAAAESFTVAQAQYGAGATDYITMLNARQTLLNAKTGLVKAQAARLEDTAALFQALGGGWWNRVDETSQAFPKPASPADELPLAAIRQLHAPAAAVPTSANPQGSPKL